MDSEAPQIDERIANFRLDGVLGRGGMGVVYRAHDLRLDRRVALKVIAPELSGDTEFRQRFLREARLAARLDHPHVVPVFEAGEGADGRLYLAMRYVDGCDLKVILIRDGRLGVERVIGLTRQVASALATAHSSGIVHRDIKPSNILVTQSGGQEHAYVADFGLTKELGTQTMSRSGGFLGTLAYAAPEQIRGAEIDGRVDVYALGCVVYQCLTGTTPFDGGEAALIWAHLEQPPPSIAVTIPALATLDAVLARALAKDPDDRYATAVEFARELEAAIVFEAPRGARVGVSTDRITEDEAGGGVPPLSSTPATNLPTPQSTFVGRAEELADVVALLRSTFRLVTLTGPGGVGKTRLALEAARAVVADFPAGVFWVGLAPLRNPGLVVNAVANAIGARDDLEQHIGERRMLLLLDNLEHVIEAAPGLAQLLETCPHLRFVCTSRARLHLSGECEFHVGPLKADEAIALFTSRGHVEPDRDVQEICRRLDHLPLAIELAAARVPLLPPSLLLQRLEQRLPLLAGGVRDAPERQRTLRAAIEWSHDLLAERDQQVFQRLSVFAGGCALAAAETVCGADLDALQSVVEKSLVQQTGGRLWMFETIREYATERLLEHPDHELLFQRHAEHYLELAEQIAADESAESRPRALQQLDNEHDNLRAARAWFHNTGQVDAELKLLCALEDFWDVRGHVTEARGYFEAALESTTSQSSPGLRARALAIASDLARDMGALGSARTYSEESLALFRQAGDEEGVARALHELGETALGAEEYDRAIELFEEAIVVGRAAGGDGASSIGNLGWTAFLQGDYERAAALAEEAIELLRQRGRMSHMVIGLQNLAEAELALERRDAARMHLLQCLQLAKEARFAEMTAYGLETTAELLFSVGKPEPAVTLVGAGDALLERLDFAPHPAVQRRRDSFRADLRAAVAADRVEALQGRGRALTDDEATDLALEILTKLRVTPA